MPAAKENTMIPGLRILGDCPVPVWGISSAERLRRQVRSAGVDAEAGLRGSVLLLRSDYVYDQRVINKLVAASNTLLGATDNGSYTPVAAHVDEVNAPSVERVLAGEPGAADALALTRATAESLSGTYVEELLKTQEPILVQLRADRRREIEKRLFDGSYKGVTDVVTKYVWPLPARWVVRLCADTGIRPNHVTLAGFGCVLLATALFAYGWFGTGLVLAWLMTFFDTVDGKLARVTIDGSRFGHFLDKIVDIVHPPFWYMAWGVGLSSSSTPLPAEQVQHLLVAIVAGYIVGRLSEGAFSHLLAGFSMFTWQPFDSGFRMIMARRNPCLIALTFGLLVGRPDWGLIVVAVWTVLSSAILLARLLQGVYQRATVGPLRPWLSASSASNPIAATPGAPAGSSRPTVA
jgi:phosphatidylglycerophosphate synthase